jgi:Bacterial lipid A biosynthesis acyltransferase/CorA-like Mg2+ transporter protein
MALTQRAASAAYRLGWLVVRRVPEPWARWVFRQIADILWRRQGKSVQQLEANLRRVVPGATGKQLRELSRAGMRSYLRYFMEAFRLPVMPRERIVAQVRATFGLHELAVEDAQNFHMRPKIELYDQDVRLVILRTARYDDAAEEVEFGEISVFLAPTFVITVRQGVASELRGPGSGWSSGRNCSPPAARPHCGRSWIRWQTITRLQDSRRGARRRPPPAGQVPARRGLPELLGCGSLPRRARGGWPRERAPACG